MATFDSDGLDDLMLSMSELAAMPDSIKDEILNAQADVVVEAQKQTARSYGVEDTGLMVEKIKKTKAKTDKHGVRSIHVYPQGSRTRHGTKTRNAEIAFENEYGNADQTARPFVRDANERSADETTAAGADKYDSWLKSLNL